jgi:Tfp pilus assembly protein PilE
MIQLKLVVIAMMVAAVTSLMFTNSAVMEQFVKAQNTTANMTDSTGNVSQSDESGSVSGLLKPPGCDLYPC